MNDRIRSVFYYKTYPFCITNIPLPDCNDGFVYMLMSLKQHSYIYIWETQCIKTRLLNHSSGNRSVLTTPLHLRPYVIIAFIGEFEGNRILGQYIEWQWQQSIIAQLRNGINDTRKIVRSGSVVIDQNNSLKDAKKTIQLKLQILVNQIKNIHIKY